MSDQSLSAAHDQQGDLGGMNSNKRKRDSNDMEDHQRLSRSSHGPGTNGDLEGVTGYDHGLSNPSDFQIDQQLLQHVGNQNGVSDENALTAKAALAAHTPQPKYPPPPEFDSNALAHGLSFPDDIPQSMTSTANAVYAAREATQLNSKPSVGSPEWHTIRKHNHKEVERRRRETINEGINQLARIVPNCDKNKGAILQRTIEYLEHLHKQAATMNDRWEQTNMTTNQALAEIGVQNNKLKLEVNRRGDIAMKWIQRCRDAGLDFDDYEDDKSLAQLEVDQSQG